jgi:hypothetical protein
MKTMKHSRGLGAVAPQVHLAEGDEDRDAMIEQLTEMGFHEAELADAPDETLAAILRVYGNLDAEDAEDAEDEDDGGEGLEDERPTVDEYDLPEPEDDDEREQFAERVKGHYHRASRALHKYMGRHGARKFMAKHHGFSYADDANSARGATSVGLLGAGTDRDTPPKWTAARYEDEFAKNEAALGQFGIRTPAELKRHREGRRVMTHCDPPRQSKEGKGENLDRYSEMPAGVRREAVRFAESRIRRGDARYTGQTKQDYERIYLDATPSQRRELLGVR